MMARENIDLSKPLDGEAILVIDPYPLADSGNFQMTTGTVPIQAAERWLGRSLNADVKLQHHHGDRFTAWIDGAQQRDLVEIKAHMSRKRARVARAQQVRSVMASKRRPQLPLPGIEPGHEPIEIEIPTMDWEQIGGDTDPGAHGGLLATGDGHAIELIQIQPVRDYVGDKEAAEVGFPFWTKEAYFDAADLDPKNEDVQSALQTVGLEWDDLEEMEPTQRALAIAEALIQYGRADEGPAGWSGDIGIPDKVKWWGDKVAGAEYLADEDEAFRNDVLGYDDIRSALEEMVQQMADQSNAEAWSTSGDQMLIDLEADGYDPNTVVNIADFGDAVAVNGDLTEETASAVMSQLEAEGYEETNYGGRIPTEEAEVSAEHVVRAVAQEMERSEEDVEKAAESLDWWQENIPWSSSGDGSVWAKRKSDAETETEERRRPRR